MGEQRGEKRGQYGHVVVDYNALHAFPERGVANGKLRAPLLFGFSPRAHC